MPAAFRSPCRIDVANVEPVAERTQPNRSPAANTWSNDEDVILHMEGGP